MYADLHVHSQYSDGASSLQEIVAKAKENDITLLSICDHNTIEAYIKESDFCSNTNIRLITGAEIHAVMNDKEYHILAYRFDTKNETLVELLEYNCGILDEMGSKLIEEMSKDYSALSIKEFSRYERVLKNGGWSSLDYLKSKGLAHDWTDYLKYMRQYNTALDRDFKHPVDVIKIIQNAGGYAILAHLGDSTSQNLQKCEKILSKFVSMGIDGFECYYPSHTYDITELLLNVCHKRDLIVTAGSDDHGGFNNISGGLEYDMSIGKVEIKLLNLEKFWM